jgi:hypothetical protein
MKPTVDPIKMLNNFCRFIRVTGTEVNEKDRFSTSAACGRQS